MRERKILSFPISLNFSHFRETIHKLFMPFMLLTVIITLRTLGRRHLLVVHGGTSCGQVRRNVFHRSTLRHGRQGLNDARRHRRPGLTERRVLRRDGRCRWQRQAQTGPTGLQVTLGVFHQSLRHGLVWVWSSLWMSELALVPVRAFLRIQEYYTFKNSIHNLT